MRKYQPNAVISHLMAQLRASQTPRFQAKLALVNANLDPKAFSDHPTIPVYVEGCRRRAAKLGYSFDSFWMHDPELKASSWIRILRARGIKGIVVVGLMDRNRLPVHLEAVWEAFPTVVTGVRTRDPALSFSCVDHHNLSLAAFEKALELGYRRPALVLDEVIDQLVECRFSAGILIGQESLPKRRRVPAFTAFSEAGADPSVFYRWLDHHQPDVVFTLYNQVLHWLEDRPMRIPEDIGLIQLEWRAARPDIAGMHQHNDVAGEAAVDMVISQIHNNESGIPDFPRATLIGATWKHGKTVLDNHDNGERRTEVVVRSAPTSNDRSGGAER